jgi:hypothetical protein
MLSMLCSRCASHAPAFGVGTYLLVAAGSILMVWGALRWALRR